MSVAIRLRCRTCGTVESFEETHNIDDSEWLEVAAFGAYEGNGIVEHRGFCTEECQEAW